MRQRPPVPERWRPRLVRNPKTRADVCRNMILRGASNSEIAAELERRFGKGPKGQKYYPAWYRGWMRRRGELPPQFENKRRHSDVIIVFED